MISIDKWTTEDEFRVDTLVAERNILTCILKKPSIIYDVKDKIKKEDFNLKHNRALYSVLLYIATEQDMNESEFDPITIITIAEQYDDIKQVFINVFGNGGNKASKEVIDYVTSLRKAGALIESKSVNIHIKELLKANAVNEMVEEDRMMLEEIKENYAEMDLDELFNKKESSILKVSNKYSAMMEEEPKRAGEGLREEIMNREYNPNMFIGLPSPFPSLNILTGGIMRKGSVTVFNAPSGTGKSMMLKNLTKYVGVDLNKPVALMANEMTDEEQKDRLVAEVAGVPSKVVEHALFNAPHKTIEYKDKFFRKIYNVAELKEKVDKAISIIEEAPIYIEQMREYTTDRIVQRAKYYKVRYNIELFVWDHVKASSDFNGGVSDKVEILARMVKAFKEKIADPLQIPVVTASQSKNYEYWQTGNSYGIEKNCTCLIILRELSTKEKQKNPTKGDYGLFVKKNRYGGEHSDHENEWISVHMNKQELVFREM